MMDTTKLVVDQQVHMRSGHISGWAKVVEVSPTGVTVETIEYLPAQLIRFDKEGILVGDNNSVCSNTWGLKGPFKLYLNRLEED
jgi:hypothetical protein